ncbi:LOW QUALITY PROTEIN: Pol Polyprotein [Phytophthora megakarya]|uniref:Pol Polyprotein n=1 Tax=Phytophthora megakarya TaxID=4795 RepID=A0A225WL49_9STRA|nr:LOW QUALITY PROTEIN: Pol Polyprotein [Phytophthora megakarya]
MPQEILNAPATFKRLVTQLFRPLRAFTQTYFDDIFVHSRAEGGKTAVEVHVEHLRRVVEVMRANNLYANIGKCVFAAEEIKALGCYVSNAGVRADPEKVKAIAAWSTPRSQKDLQKWLGLANYLHKYSAGYAGRARLLSDLLKKEVKPFTVVCDASDYAIGCALLQEDTEGRDRDISSQSRQLKAAEQNYPVDDKELLPMKYALVKFHVHLLGTQPFVVFTDHASLRTAINTPHLSQRMTRWLSFFAEYNFRVEYKPGKLNVLAMRCHAGPTTSWPILVGPRQIYMTGYAWRRRESRAPSAGFDRWHECQYLVANASTAGETTPLLVAEGLLHYRVEPSDPPRVVVPNDEDLKYDVLLEAHDVPSSGHLDHEKTFYGVSGTLWRSHMYVKTCETCQRVKPAGHVSAPLQSLPVPSDCWKVMCLDFGFGFPANRHGNTGILMFVCRLSKLVHLAPVRETVTGEQAATLFLDGVFRFRSLPESVVSDKNPLFYRCVLANAVPVSRNETERVNRVLEDTLRGVCAEAPQSWSDRLPMVAFALNNAVHVSTGFTPFYLNGLRHPSMPLTLRGGHRAFSREAPKILSSQVSDPCRKQLSDFVDNRLNAISRVSDAMANAQDKQKEYSDKHGRGNFNLSTISSTGSNELKHRFIGPFAVLGRQGAAYTIDLPKSMTTHTTFYVGRLKRYQDPLGPTKPLGAAAGRDDQENRAHKTEVRPQEQGAPQEDAEDTRRSKQAGKPAGDAHMPGNSTITWSGYSKGGDFTGSAGSGGYPESQNSWEPYERLLADCPKAVAIWEQTRRQLRK